MALFSLTCTDSRCQVAVFTVSAAARAAGKRHRVAVAAGLALVVEITETQRTRVEAIFICRRRGCNHRAVKLGMISGGDSKAPLPANIPLCSTTLLPFWVIFSPDALTLRASGEAQDGLVGWLFTLLWAMGTKQWRPGSVNITR